MYPLQLILFTALVALGTAYGQSLDETLETGGGYMHTELTLNPGDDYAIMVSDGDRLYSTCRTSEEDEEDYTLSWVSRNRYGEEKILSHTSVLDIASITTEMLRDPIYCVASSIYSDDTVDKQLSVRMEGRGKRLTVVTMEGDDPYRGLVRRRCQLEPPPAERYDYQWFDPYGRVISSNNELSLTISESVSLGEYLCRAVNVATGEQHEAKYKISATVGPGTSATRYYVSIIPNSRNPTLYERHEMSCNVSPLPADQIRYQWFLNGQYIGAEKVYVIDALSTETVGRYECQATWDPRLEPARAEYKITLGSEMPASYAVEISPISRTAMLYEPYEMNCEVRPSPPGRVRYTWTRNGQHVQSGQTLRIDYLTKWNIGEYQCEVSGIDDGMNGALAQLIPAVLRVSVPPTPSSENDMVAPPGAVIVTEVGEDRELHCEFTGLSSGSEVVWRFNDSVIDEYSHLNRTGHVGRMDRKSVSIILLKDVQLEHEGLYECRARGVLLQARLVVIAGSLELEVNPPELRVDEGEVFEFHCGIKGKADIRNTDLQWYFRRFGDSYKQPIDFSPQSGFWRTDNPQFAKTSFLNHSSARKSHEGYYIVVEPRTGQEAMARLYVNKAESRRVQLVITPSTIRIRAGNTASVECFLSDESGSQIGQQGPRLQSRNPRLNLQLDRSYGPVSRATTPPLDASYNGTVIECIDERSGAATVTSIILVEDDCGPGSRRCRNGVCIRAGQFCDGNYDCPDRSDEDPLFCNACDPIAKKCMEHRGYTPSKNTYMIHWECDGEDDCGNGYDESNCPQHEVASCGDTMHTCQRSQTRIPFAYLCDSERDCPEGDDERECADPTIMTTPLQRYTARRGQEMVLTCEVTGMPLPRVIWRFNWGCLPDEGQRFSISSTARGCGGSRPTVTSTLRITNFRPGDDGIYNCEALAGTKRSLSSDFHVLLGA